MNNLLSYCGLVDPRISASDKDLPVSLVEQDTIGNVSAAYYATFFFIIFFAYKNMKNPL